MDVQWAIGQQAFPLVDLMFGAERKTRSEGEGEERLRRLWKLSSRSGLVKGVSTQGI